MRPHWTSRALADVAEVMKHIAADDPQAANRLLDRVLSLVEEALPAQPLLGRPGRVAQTREFVVHASYILVYRVQANRLEILAFRHSTRRWPEQF